MAVTASTFPQQTSRYGFALTALASLFFMWGFITCLNDILIPHLKNVFALNYTQAMLIQFCFFAAYFVVSLPAGTLITRIGYKWGLVVGLVTAAIGCFLFIPAASYRIYALFLGALFIMASGVTILQVAANPYVTVLGSSQTASSRLTLTHSFNSLGTAVAPWFGGFLILGGAMAVADNLTPAQLAAMHLHEADAVKLPYLMLAITFSVLAVVFALLKLPDVRERQDSQALKDTTAMGSAWHFPHLVLGAVGIFTYVGAEVSIGSLLVNFLGEDHIAGLPEAQAAYYVSFYWGGAMVGRFIGFFVMRYVSAGKVLTFNAMMATALLVVTVLYSGQVAMWAVLAVGLFNSIMFPTIFSLALRGLGRFTSQGSGILCLAIVGGAILPPLVGAVADTLGLQMAFALPIICYVYIAFYGLKGSVPRL
ncbi:sugar MFS transporter [Gallaecimonas pentaromativorans]|uniref:sugar MFS transporter n=1 Tax=Gallaecimonas pentaromativorans TaxID=584787 RepID=UPI00067EC748|nr:sugar MFS transporter [Gallaecimonas pentaromativorans]MED5525903.1 sugar MFS transporter [Pseudomonadota bacterium]